MQSRILAYVRIFWGALFLYWLALGHADNAWKDVIVPLLASAAFLIWTASLRERHPQFAGKLIWTASVLMTIFVIRSTTQTHAPRLYSTVADLLRENSLEFQQAHEPRLLEAREGLADYIRDTENIDAKELLKEANALRAKRAAGQFSKDDEKKEQELFKKFGELAQRQESLKKSLQQLQEPQVPPPPTSAVTISQPTQPVTSSQPGPVVPISHQQPSLHKVEASALQENSDSPTNAPASVQTPQEPPSSSQTPKKEPDFKNHRTVRAGDFIIQVNYCVRASRRVTCQLLITNTSEDQNFHLHADIGPQYASRLFDSKGNEYRAATVRLGSYESQSYIENRLVRDVPMSGQIIFENVSEVDRIVTLIVGCWDTHENYALKVQPVPQSN